MEEEQDRRGVVEEKRERRSSLAPLIENVGTNNNGRFLRTGCNLGNYRSTNILRI